jgi:hypothetical protein
VRILTARMRFPSNEARAIKIFYVGIRTTIIRSMSNKTIATMIVCERTNIYYFGSGKMRVEISIRTIYIEILMSLISFGSNKMETD